MDEDVDRSQAENYASLANAGPLVSIVIPTFNRAGLLVDALRSIAAARYRPIEVVIADDGSSDDTAARVQAFADSHPDLAAQFLRLPHGGAIRARNAGAAAAQGAYIFFLDSDDLLAPDGLSAMVAALADPQVPYCVGQLIEQDLSGHTVFAEGHSDPVLDHVSVVRSQWPTIVGLYRREVFDRLGVFNDQLAFGEDKEFLWRIVAGSPPGKILPDLVAIRRNHGHGQLTDGYSVGVMGRHTIAALDAFCDWASREGVMRPAIASATRPRLWLATVRAGSAGIAPALAQARNLSAKLEAIKPSVVNRLVMGLFARTPRAGFVLLYRLLGMARAALHLARNLRRRLTW